MAPAISPSSVRSMTWLQGRKISTTAIDLILSLISYQLNKKTQMNKIWCNNHNTTRSQSFIYLFITFIVQLLCLKISKNDNMFDYWSTKEKLLQDYYSQYFWFKMQLYQVNCILPLKYVIET